MPFARSTRPPCDASVPSCAMHITPALPPARMAGRGAKDGAGLAGQGGGSGPPPIRLDVAVRNLGPVARGSVAARPLTILIGPNNSGKSYVATMLRSILTVPRDVAGARRRSGSAAAPRLSVNLNARVLPRELDLRQMCHGGQAGVRGGKGRYFCAGRECQRLPTRAHPVGERRTARSAVAQRLGRGLYGGRYTQRAFHALPPARTGRQRLGRRPQMPPWAPISVRLRAAVPEPCRSPRAPRMPWLP